MDIGGDAGITREREPDGQTPEDVLKQAAALDQKDRVAEALDLLETRQHAFADVPPEYHAAVSRLHMRLGQVDKATSSLLVAHEAYGGESPAKFRRHLAKTLLAAGKVESAGEILHSFVKKAGGEPPAWTLRRGRMAALEAYRHKSAEMPDEGPATPYRIVAQAEVLVERRERTAALELLRKHADDWPSVPAGYKSMLTKLSRRVGDKDARIAKLTRKRAAGRMPDTGEAHVKLAMELFEAGRIDEAGQELDQAADKGEEIERIDLAIVLDMYRRQHEKGSYDTSFGRLVTLVNPEKHLVYVPITKNACTLLKTNFVMNGAHRDDYAAKNEHIHAFVDALPKEIPRQEYLGPDYFRFTVLRDPARRLVSAYLNKVVRPRRNPQTYRRLAFMEHTIRGAQQMVDVAFDPIRSITFEEFVRFLARVPDYQCNKHWMPQHRIAGTDLSRYHHVGKLERLQDTLDLLNERFGFTIETQQDAGQPIGGARHLTKYSGTTVLDAPWKALPRELDEHEHDMPAPEQFYSPALLQLMEERFAADFAIYRSA